MTDLLQIKITHSADGRVTANIYIKQSMINRVVGQISVDHT